MEKKQAKEIEVKEQEQPTEAEQQRFYVLLARLVRQVSERLQQEDNLEKTA